MEGEAAQTLVPVAGLDRRAPHRLDVEEQRRGAGVAVDAPDFAATIATIDIRLPVAGMIEIVQLSVGFRRSAARRRTEIDQPNLDAALLDLVDDRVALLLYRIHPDRWAGVGIGRLGGLGGRREAWEHAGHGQPAEPGQRALQQRPAAGRGYGTFGVEIRHSSFLLGNLLFRHRAAFSANHTSEDHLLPMVDIGSRALRAEGRENPVFP